MKMFRHEIIVSEGFNPCDLFQNESHLKAKARREAAFRSLRSLQSLVIYVSRKLPRAGSIGCPQLASLGWWVTKVGYGDDDRTVH